MTSAIDFIFFPVVDDTPEDVGYARINDTELIDLTSDERTIRVEDEDWEVAEKDFTKPYNRLRQHLACDPDQQRAPLRRRLRSLQSTAARKAASTVAKDQTASQLASTYGSRIADMDHSLGVVVNRKGASAYANLKDKTDRTTTEQVLDARTRVVLLKMVGWGIMGFHRGDQWLWINNDDHNEYDIDIKYYDYKDKDHKGKQYT
ncbi:hypothetical protein EV421DRAFT_1901567 [Armillaria borealis]|uniref:Uncharacterized protein n=1 Tax=Armillaria borealis TaxID=47425 RepID=A0AA39JSM4_9AGAR|nr:hypothetical protein EV421DRAFT_1901567 [Armillaria borealis]